MILKVLLQLVLLAVVRWIMSMRTNAMKRVAIVVDGYHPGFHYEQVEMVEMIRPNRGQQ